MSEEVTVFAIVEADQPDMARVQSAVADLARHSVAEPGCLRYDVHLSIKAPARLIIHEIWANDAAVETHRRSSHIASFKAAIADTTAIVWASPFLLLK